MLRLGTCRVPLCSPRQYFSTKTIKDAAMASSTRSASKSPPWSARASNDQYALKSIYQIRQYDIRKLSLLTNPHIFLSHDWPQGITEHGDLAVLLRDKPALKSEIIDKIFGPPLMDPLKMLQPKWWFAAHMHTYFKTTVKHDDSVTNFTALNKCLPRRKCIEVIDVPATSGTTKLTFDPEWLAITRGFQPFFNDGQARSLLPPYIILVLEYNLFVCIILVSRILILLTASQTYYMV
ncbi:hypothetical protein DFS33DRAFT_935313 [Desarmillaria ectypa]|nr:hypothetical protein DFS33DRAFT_935313 [Desarmillaria ectypa]